MKPHILKPIQAAVPTITFDVSNTLFVERSASARTRTLTRTTRTLTHTPPR